MLKKYIFLLSTSIILVIGGAISFLVFSSTYTQKPTPIIIKELLSPLKSIPEPEVNPLLALVKKPNEPVSPTPQVPITTFSVPILLYHYIRDYTDPNDPTGITLSVSPENFDKQMQWLSEHNFQTVDLDYFSNPYKTDKRPIVITFDDGYQDAYESAVPILLKYGFSGTFYIITDKAETPGYLTWKEMRQMQEVGMIIGSHTRSHPALVLLSKEHVYQELSESKKILEEKLGVEIANFCYPYGKHNDTNVDTAKEAGYQTATTTKKGINTEKTNIHRLKRVNARNNSDFSLFPELNEKIKQ